jgi:cholesterol transport system auxiliary component
MKPPSRSPLRAFARAFAAAAGAVLIATALGACSLSRPAPVKRTFLLEPPAPARLATTRATTLRVGAFSVGAAYRGKAFVYRQDDLEFEADFYNEFFVAPAAMLSEAAAKALAASGAFRRVIPPGATDEGDWVLDGFVGELYGDARDAAKPAAVLSVTFYLSPAHSLVPSVAWSREYRQRVPVAAPGPDGLAAAWNAALGAVLADLARDLAAAELPKP